MNSTTSAILDNKLDREKNYWLDKLADGLGATQLPLDNKRPAVFNAVRESVTFRLGAETEARLRELCAGKETLAFAVLVAALKVCLHKYTGARDIIIGTSIHECHDDTSALNRVLALRDVVDPAASVRQLLQAVKTTLAEAYANQKFSFERVVELLNVEQPVNRTPLFSVVAILDSAASRANVRQLMNDVTVVYAVKEESTTCSIEYNPELFLRETIEVFAGHLQSVLLGVLSDTSAAVGGLDLLTAEKRHEFVSDFNETEGNIHGLRPSPGCSRRRSRARPTRRPSPTGSGASPTPN